MAEALNTPFPNTLRTKVHAGHVALLLEMGDPGSIDRAAAQAVLDDDGIFEARLMTRADNPEGAIYRIDVLDAAVVAHRGLLTRQKLIEVFDGDVPEAVDAPEDSGNTTPVIVPWNLIAQAVESLD